MYFIWTNSLGWELTLLKREDSEKTNTKPMNTTYYRQALQCSVLNNSTCYDITLNLNLSNIGCVQNTLSFLLIANLLLTMYI